MRELDFGSAERELNAHEDEKRTVTNSNWTAGDPFYLQSFLSFQKRTKKTRKTPVDEVVRGYITYTSQNRNKRGRHETL